MTLREPVDRIISQLFFQNQTNATTESEMARHILQNPGFPTELSQHMTSLFFPPKKLRQHGGSLVMLAQKACQVVGNMAWVGFADDYERSICLLHARYDFPHHPEEMKNMRRTARRKKGSTSLRLGSLCGINPRRFERELEQWAPHCK